AAERTASRLMVLSRDGGVSARHTTFVHLPDFLRNGDVLVVNRTRVVPARMFGKRAAGAQEFEIFFLHKRDDHHFMAWAKPGKKLRPGHVLDIAGGGRVTFRGREGDRAGLFELSDGDTVDTLLERSGHVPLPPYIHRADADADRERYQTIFARDPGSVAAPTAGLHFDEGLLVSRRANGIQVAEVTLHVGPGTFQPLFDEEVEKNTLHAERFAIDATVLREVALAKREGRRVVAVGTTVTRTLEH